MFNDRDLGVLGLGALLAVGCLILPLPFWGKVTLGLFVLVGFTVLALLRLGSDRIPLEEWLLRRLRFHLQASRYTYQQPGYSTKRPWRLKKLLPRQKTLQPVHAPKNSESTPMRSFCPATLTLEDIGIYPLVTVLLAVIGTYFLFWLAQGGAEEIARLIGGVFP